MRWVLMVRKRRARSIFLYWQCIQRTFNSRQDAEEALQWIASPFDLHRIIRVDNLPIGESDAA
jgi:hypothetical protein